MKKIAALDIHSPLCLSTTTNYFAAGDIGDLYPLIDKAAKAGFSLIQLGPIHDTGEYQPNPYKPLSTFSYNPIHVDTNHLPGFNPKPFLKAHQSQIQALNQDSGKYSYQDIYKLKIEALKLSYHHVKHNPSLDFFKYKKNIFQHIKNYAIYKTISQQHGQNWTIWPKKLKPLFADFHLYTQWILHTQWQQVKTYAQKHNIQFLIDKPIYPIPNSSDVWANPSLFYLNADGTPQYISGCNNPGDPFGQQTWGHAVYQFQQKPDEVIKIFINNLQFLSQLSPIIRIDNGEHHPAIKNHLFSKIKQHMPHLNLIAEDVGFVSQKEVDKPLAKLGLPGLRCFQWNHPKYLNLSTYPANSIALTANHDTQSVQGWINSASRQDVQQFKQHNPEFKNQEKINPWDIIKKVFNTNSKIATITLRDLENDPRRYNKPGSENSHNWSNRMQTPIKNLNIKQITSIIHQSNRNPLTNTI